MGKKIATFVTIVLLSVSLFAATPTGSVTLTYSNANADNSCPAAPGLHNITSVTLDASGNYTNQWTPSIGPGVYCVYAHYNGDSQHAPSDATPYVHTITATSTNTTVSVAPEPSSQGVQVSISGNVQ